MSRLEIEAFSPKVRAMEMALHWCCAGPHTPRGGTRTTERPTNKKDIALPRCPLGPLQVKVCHTTANLAHQLSFPGERALRHLVLCRTWTWIIVTFR